MGEDIVPSFFIFCKHVKFLACFIASSLVFSFLFHTCTRVFIYLPRNVLPLIISVVGNRCLVFKENV